MNTVFEYSQKGQRNDTVNVIVKLEFGERPLGESDKVECAADRDANINYNTSMNIIVDDPLILDDLANKPVVCMSSSMLFLKNQCSAVIMYKYVCVSACVWQVSTSCKTFHDDLSLWLIA